MNLLVVDDQIRVAEGIAQGIDWGNCGFTQVFCAYSAIEAKQYLSLYEIDVMLCDIEMPYESGLDLLQWVSEQGISVKCIMLTAHAEFKYAQQAIKLGSVDYILQPAPYEDIKNAVLRAVKEIQEKKVRDSLRDIGKNVADASKNLSRDLFFVHLQGKNEDYKVLDSLNSFPKERDPFWLMSFQIIHWQGERLKTEEMMFLFDNVCEELLSPYRQKHLLTSCDLNVCTVIVWGEEELISWLFLSRQIEFFLSVCEQYKRFRVAVYVRGGEKRSQLAALWSELRTMMRENVARTGGLFSEHEEKETEYKFIYKNRWVHQLKDGCGETTRFEAKKCLREMAEAKTLTKENLKRFYFDFLQVAFVAAGTEKDLMEKVLCAPQDFELYYNGAESVESMEQLIDKIIDALSKEDEEDSSDIQGVLKKAQKYIQEHIRDELRRDEVADAVHLNADYLSKLFKKELGLPLKEYILEQKMRQAQNLLKTTVLPVGIIATMVGYDNFSHFSQVYKRMIGERPVDTRNHEKDE